MKTLMVAHHFESRVGGIEIVAAQLAREISQRSLDVSLLASNSSSPPRESEVGHRVVAVSAVDFLDRWAGISWPVPTYRAAVDIWREVRRADVLVLHDTLYPFCIFAFFSAKLMGRPALVIQHVGVTRFANHIFYWIMEFANRIVARSILARADRVVFGGDIPAAYFGGVRFSAPPIVIYPGVDTDVFKPLPPDGKAAARRRFGLEAQRPSALFVGRFVKHKGLDILARMARLRPDVLWAFAGQGNLDPRAWGLPNVLAFSDLRGPSLALLYQASDIFVLPSMGESFSLVIQEALACGLPVVCSAPIVDADKKRAPFLSSVPVDEAKPEATAAAFCTAVDRALEDDAQGRLRASERFQFISDHYSWKACANQYHEIMLSLSDYHSQR
jgi:glycosyltransferase involved in cell wall biosynthesis